KLRIALVLATTRLLHGCTPAECATAKYSDAECRVLAENAMARLRTAGGVEIRFQDPDAVDDDTWIAAGLLAEPEPGIVRARVAGAGAFALSFRPPADGGEAELSVELTNVDPAAEVTVGIAGEEVEFPADDVGDTARTLPIDLSRGRTVWVRGRRACPDRFRIAVTADIQTNPNQFAKIVERLGQEAIDAEAAGEPLVALVIAGDLAESSRQDEYDALHSILARSPVPVAVTVGNHDIYRPLRPEFTRSFGPGNYDFRVCTAKVVMLDSGNGTIARSVEARLPEMLERDGAEFLLAVMHHPPHAEVTGSGWSREDTAAHLLVELAAVDADLVLAGHNHALHDYPDISIGDVTLREIVTGTAGAYQGLGVPRYGYTRLVFGDELEPCFVEVPPAGYAEPQNEGLRTLDYCDAP
ncbi:MAG TPA: metallophosphoesterase, partial [Nannocystaceae bacterium]|nr:metallophosphoesterase [Nannocystaceae bacterium]